MFCCCCFRCFHPLCCWLLRCCSIVSFVSLLHIINTIDSSSSSSELRCRRHCHRCRVAVLWWSASVFVLFCSILFLCATRWNRIAASVWWPMGWCFQPTCLSLSFFLSQPASVLLRLLLTAAARNKNKSKENKSLLLCPTPPIRAQPRKDCAILLLLCLAACRVFAIGVFFFFFFFWMWYTVHSGSSCVTRHNPHTYVTFWLYCTCNSFHPGVCCCCCCCLDWNRHCNCKSRDSIRFDSKEFRFSKKRRKEREAPIRIPFQINLNRRRSQQQHILSGWSVGRWTFQYKWRVSSLLIASSSSSSFSSSVDGTK